LDKQQDAIGEIKKITPGANLIPITSDLGDLASIKEMVDNLNIRHLDVLMLNAGIALVEYKLSKQGIESQFQVNHLSHFYLVHLLWDLIVKSKTRVVSVSAKPAMGWASLKFDLEAINDKSTYLPHNAYGNTKLANVHFTLELAKRGIHACVIDPGPVGTGIGAKANGSGLFPFLARNIAFLIEVKVEIGCLTQIFASVSDKAGPGTGWTNRDQPWNLRGISTFKEQDTEELWTFSVNLLRSKGF
jgi:NAD(P)-dependent dehydrogenase (short-subunit alcohol dehydrogenase family)